MQFQISVTPSARIYYASCGLDTQNGAGLTPVEQDALAAEGEPAVQVGGSLDDGQGLAYDLPGKLLYFPSQFPATQVFSLDDFADAKARAMLWVNTLQTRVDEALTEKREDAASDGGAFSQTSTIDTTPA